MNQKEKQLEDQCVTWARRHGWDAWKNENNGNKGIPDRSFLKGDTFVMVEFKRDVMAPIRYEQITWQRKHPATVYFIWSFEDFTELLTNKNPKQ